MTTNQGHQNTDDVAVQIATRYGPDCPSEEPTPVIEGVPTQVAIPFDGGFGALFSTAVGARVIPLLCVDPNKEP